MPSLQAPASVTLPGLPRETSCLRAYCARIKGSGALRAAPLPPSARAVVIALLGSFFGMLALTSVDRAASIRGYEVCAPALAQPRNVIGGQTISALVGVACRVLLIDLTGATDATFAVAALAVALSIAAMLLTGTLHPAGSGSAYLAVTSAVAIEAGWLFIFLPVFVASVVIVVCAVLWNNLFEELSCILAVLTPARAEHAGGRRWKAQYRFCGQSGTAAYRGATQRPRPS